MYPVGIRKQISIRIIDHADCVHVLPLTASGSYKIAGHMLARCLRQVYAQYKPPHDISIMFTMTGPCEIALPGFKSATVFETNF